MSDATPPDAEYALPYGMRREDWIRDEEEEADRRWKRSHPMPADTLPEPDPPRCRVCHFVIDVADDVALLHDGTACVCVRCFAREADAELPMPKALRLEISRIINDVKG